MKPDDLVDLIISTKQSYLYVNNLKRKQASELIRRWWDKRQIVMENREESENVKWWLEKGTLVFNAPYSDGSGDFAFLTVAWDQVVGMCIKELVKDQNLYERQVKSMEKVVKIMEKEVSHGEEWKDGEDE